MKMNDRDEPEAGAWEPGWDGHLAAQRLRLARLPLAEKLQWLEEAQRLARRLTGDASRPAPAADCSGSGDEPAQE